MTRLLITGYGPLPFEKTQRFYAPGLRLWHFISALDDADNQLCVIAGRHPAAYPDTLPDLIRQPVGKWDYYSLAENRFSDPETVRGIVAQFAPDAILGVTTSAAYMISCLNMPVPLWADMYGSLMAESQTKAFTHRTDKFFDHFLNIELAVLKKADVFSTVSERQKHLLIGELAMTGRLNQFTVGYDFVVPIPIAPSPLPPHAQKHMIRGKLATETDFVILYSGTYNTWVDVDTMFAALEVVMARRPDAVFVSTGGVIAGHDEVTYRRFEALVHQSPYRDRCHLMGWVPTEDVPGYVQDSDVGICPDLYAYEAIYGSRTRVVEWLQAGLPAVLSSMTEVGQTLCAANAAFLYEAGNAHSLAECLLTVASQPERIEEARQQGKHFLETQLSYHATATAVCKWAAHPTFSPDHNKFFPLIRLAGSVAEPPGQGPPTAKAFSLSNLLRGMLWQASKPFFRSSKQEDIVRRWRALLDIPAMYRCDVTDVEAPPIMKPGLEYVIVAEIKNTGRHPWLTVGHDSVNLSFQWLDERNLPIAHEKTRTALLRPIPANGSVRQHLMVQPPSRPGRFKFFVDPVLEGFFWFSDLRENRFLTEVVVEA